MSPTTEAYVDRVRDTRPAIRIAPPIVHGPITHATVRMHGTLVLSGGWREAVSLITEDDALAAKLAAAINDVLAEHDATRAAPALEAAE